jgi:uncharacterized protein YukE
LYAADGESQQAQFEQASSELNQGLKTCRTMLENYRVMLTGQNDGEPAEPRPHENDNAE